MRQPFARVALAAALFSAAASGAQADGFDVDNLQLLNDRAVPEVCFTFNQDLLSDPEAYLEDYVRVAPQADTAVTASGETLCVAGLAFGTRYDVTLRQGLPAAVAGSSLAQDRSYDVYVADRPASLTFLGDQGYILLKDLAKGLPIRAVNLTTADFKVIQVNDRNLMPQLADGSLGGQGELYPNEVETYAEQAGVQVWEGQIDLPKGKPNQAADSQIPVAEVMEKTPTPGLYLAVARQPGVESWEPWSSQWFLISDIGLTSFAAENALWVFARSLSDATPQAGMTVRLLAKDNAVLAEAKTDAGGKVSFPGASLRGPGGKAPRALLAYGAGGDFTFLNLTAPALDLSDRPVAGRTPPGAVEAYVYSERGIYRPGETLHLVALLRDRALKAEEKLPLTFKLWRPDGAEFRSQVAEDAGGGAHSWSPTLPGTARTGLWEATAHLGPKGPAIGRVSFEVEDFVPPQIEFDLTVATKMAEAETAFPAELQADYLYGAPAANLAGEYSLIVQQAEAPFPQFQDYAFGLVQQTVRPQRSDPVSFTTDAAGKAELQAEVESLPDSMAPLSVSLRAAVFDIGGRAVYRRATLPLEDKAYYLGIRPGFEGGSVASGQSASFQVVALDRTGEEQAVDGLDYRVYREDYDFVWYREQGQWKSRWVVRDSLADQGIVDLTPGQPGEIEFTPDWGPYRVEVIADGGQVMSSLRFSGGWWSDPSADTPDAVEVSLDKQSYGAGETAKVFVKPPFESHVLVTVADSDLRWSTTLEVSREGGFVEIPVAADWTAGAYVIASAYPKKPASIEALPTRAVGLAWLARDASPHALALDMTLPAKMEPSRSLAVPIAVSGAKAGAEVYVTLAAVDDAVLQITGYQAPDPLAWLLAKQALGVSLHDLYGYLIKPQGEALAKLRSGGDQEGRNLESLPERSSKVVSLFSGIVKLDGAGKASISLDVPDFNGRLRLMAVAWSPEKLGAAQQTMIVRAPLIAEVTLPRFLAPGDVADTIVSLRNLDGAAGDYQVTVTGDAVVSVSGGALAAARLAQGKEARATRKLTAEQVGVAKLRLEVTGPEGYSLQRDFALSVRPASPLVTERRVALLPPGRSTTVSADSATGYLPRTAAVSLSLSATPDYDLPGLLAALDRYPYGCAEQTTSRALPLLYVNQVASALGLGDDAGLSLKVQQSIYRLINQQRGSGGFGLWGPYDDPQVWLTAYVADFLTRAKAAKYHVPEAGYRSALDWLEGQTRGYLDGPEDFAGYAYAQYVLTRAGRGDLSELRYFYETRFDKLPTTFARGQFAAALAYVGDRPRAAAAFRRAESGPNVAKVRWTDYGSKLRDDAALVALMAESGAAPAKLLVESIKRLSADFADASALSTQEMAWLVLASQGLVAEAGPMSLAVDGKPLADPGAAFYHRLDLSKGARQSLKVENQGKGALYQVMTLTGVPEQSLPAEEAGFTLRRRVFDLKGFPVALDALRQGESYVVLLEGRSQDGRAHRALVVDLLPAGWEIENAALGQGVPLESFPWLKELTVTEHTEARDDRFAAAVDLTPDRAGFRVAYIVRAVTPGDFTLPGSYIEDMYRPDLSARGAAGRVTIAGR
ncbi:MAG: alpha-2-macroglobulin family protein [Rhodospirillales bacterium]